MWLAAGPTARGDDTLIRRKQPNLTDYDRGPHPHMNFLVKIIQCQTTAYHASMNYGIFWSAHSDQNSN
ncbi:hypothetical protein N7505_007683 [Penicillium chrysogenum]|uniref:Uncharacterized protein n=1 Tax=Penicillium chrysogenum TaxID=5076 RepID=A0ABQ8WE37_PENCH|nr:hypothetical protein N7505_007683 [Penicillium chrysogenum]